MAVYALLLLNDNPQSYPGFLKIGYSNSLERIAIEKY
jgi:hypothetical protein